MRHRLAFGVAAGLLWGLAALAAQGPDPQPAATPDNDRNVQASAGNLRLVAAQAVRALLVDDASRLPRATDFRYTENGQALAIGDGMWGTLTAVAGEDALIAPAADALRYSFDIVDLHSGEILTLRAIDENGTPGVLALRLRLAGGAIAQMEAIAIREELSGARGGTVTLLQPQLLQMLDPARLGVVDPSFSRPAPASRESLIAVANGYFDGQVAGRSSGISFAADCVRRDNAHDSTSNASSRPLDPTVPGYRPWSLGCAAQIDSGLFRYIERVRDRRFLVDSERGVVATISVMDVPGTLHAIDVPGHGIVSYPGPARRRALNLAEQFDQFTAANLRVPSSMLSICLFKVRNAQITRMECFQRGAHLGLRTGW